ncbi:MAG: MBL fold metallo-hydrolase [Anaerolineales bacterium]
MKARGGGMVGTSWLKVVIFSSIFLIICGILVYVNQIAVSQPYSIQIAFIDVGEGDSALIQNSDGYSILLDGGQVSEGPTVLAYLRNNGVYTLNAMIASHADSDHIGGLISVLEATDITIDSVIYNGYPGNTQTWNDFVMAVTNEGLGLETAQFPGELSWGSTTAYILNPVSGLENPDTNDASLVMLLDHSDIEYLFTGDIDSTVESEILARGTPIAADILKVAHHGSNYSTSVEFLNAVQPIDSVISVGDNPYGHPGAETLARLVARGSNIWRTDLNGTILVVADDGYSYQVIPSSAEAYLFLPLMIK